jgi:hypothetical protein
MKVGKTNIIHLNMDSKMKQTAVEWLVEHILTEVRNYEDDDIENEFNEQFKHEYINKYIGMIDLSKYVIKAKEMEKEQHLKTWTEGLYCETGDRQAFEQYYNETFKSE